MGVLNIKDNNGNFISIPAIKGDDGFSPVVLEDENNTEQIYKLNIKTKDETILTPNLKGENGSSGVYLGEEEPSDINIKVWIKPDGNANVIDGSVVGL